MQGIRILQPTDAEAYQRLRLQALRNDPDAYGSTYERESQFSLQTVAERITPGAGKFVLGAFDSRDVLSGIVTWVREEGMKTSHKSHVYGMYVAAEQRRLGVGKRLMQELIDRARGIQGVEQIHLTVVAGNSPARKLYEAMGFEVYGVEPRALKLAGKYMDEELMVLRL